LTTSPILRDLRQTRKAISVKGRAALLCRRGWPRSNAALPGDNLRIFLPWFVPNRDYSMTIKCLSAADKGLFETKLVNDAAKNHWFGPTKGNVVTKLLNSVSNKLNSVTNKGLVVPNLGNFAAKLIKFEPDQIKSSLNPSHLRSLCPICEQE
jgi:hypothetical protein